jgi:hypothetical protein
MLEGAQLTDQHREKEATMIQKEKERPVDATDVVKRYFELIRALRAGDPSSVDALMSLWDDDGTFEFKGPPPLVGTFRGAMAIRTLYHNRLKANGMPLSLEMKSGGQQDVLLGVVDTDVTNIRRDGARVLAGWRTTIGTQQNQGYDVPGSHIFTFKGGKIKSLRVSVSAKPAASRIAHLDLAKLAVSDVGRLSLAAWAVV